MSPVPPRLPHPPARPRPPRRHAHPRPLRPAQRRPLAAHGLRADRVPPRPPLRQNRHDRRGHLRPRHLPRHDGHRRALLRRPRRRRAVHDGDARPLRAPLHPRHRPRPRLLRLALPPPLPQPPPPGDAMAGVGYAGGHIWNFNPGCDPLYVMSTFAELGLRSELVDTLTALGYEAPTPIQERTIPRMLAGKDLIGQAQTGTGKTAAFALPILEKIDVRSRDTQALVLTPTRELAMQVAEAIHTYSQKLGHISVLPVYGGAPLVPQLKRLERGAVVVVGTPGRIIDHLERKSLDLSKLRVLVLDEADEMLKMGFIDDVEKILSSSPPERQTALFSATMPDAVLRIAKKHLRNPERIEIEHKLMHAPSIEQRFLNVSEGQKLEVLTKILELEPAEAALIFRRTKTGAAELAEKLEARGFAAVAMHGDMTQPLRESVIRRLRAGQVDIVVATDVAARGLDVEQIEHVINYDIPYDLEAYVHR